MATCKLLTESLTSKTANTQVIARSAFIAKPCSGGMSIVIPALLRSCCLSSEGRIFTSAVAGLRSHLNSLNFGFSWDQSFSFEVFYCKPQLTKLVPLVHKQVWGAKQEQLRKLCDNGVFYLSYLSTSWYVECATGTCYHHLSNKPSCYLFLRVCGLCGHWL